MPFCALFVCVSDLEQGRFIQFLTKNLKSNRKLFSFFFQETARHADPTDAGDVCGQGENVCKVHAKRITCTLTEFERRRRRGRANDGVNFLKGSGEILSDQGSNLLRTEIISVLITRTQDVSAKDNAPLDLWTEALFSCCAVMIQQSVGYFRPETVTHSVEPRKVRGSFGGSDDGVGA